MAKQRERVVYNRFVAPTKRRGKKDSGEISIIILAASPGYRMKSYGPRALLKTDDGKTILQQILDCSSYHFPGSEILVSVGFEADKVIKDLQKEVVIVENQLYETTNMIEECRLCLNAATNDSAVIIHGDLIFNVNTLENLTKFGSSIVVDNHENMNLDEIGITEVNKNATIFSYGLGTKWCYITYLEDKEFSLFKQFCANRDRNKLFVCEGLNHVLDNGGNLRCIENEGMKISKIENSRDLLQNNEVNTTESYQITVKNNT